MLLPVLNVDIRDTSDQQLQLPLIENADKICRNELMKSFNKIIELLLNSFFNTPFGDKAR